MTDTVYGADSKPVSLDPFGAIVEINFPSRYIMFSVLAEYDFVPAQPGAAYVNDVTYGVECGPAVEAYNPAVGDELPNAWLKSFRIEVDITTQVSVLRQGAWESGGTATIARLSGFPKSVSLPAWKYMSHLNPVTHVGDEHTALEDLFGVEWVTPTGAPVQNKQEELIYPPFVQTPFRSGASARLRAMGFKYPDASAVCMGFEIGFPTGYVQKHRPGLSATHNPFNEGQEIEEASTPFSLSFSIIYQGRPYTAIGTHADRTTLRVLCEKAAGRAAQ